MGWFARRRRGAQALSSIPGLGPADTEWLVGAMTSRLGARGVQVTLAENGTLATTAGLSYGLDNIALALRHLPRPEWDAYVEHHVAALVTAVDAEPHTLAEVADQLFPRVVAGRYYGHELPDYARPLGGDLFEVLAIDQPDVIQILGRPDDVLAMGGWEAAGPVARSNLARLSAPHYELLEWGGADAQAHLFVADDFFGATRLLAVDDLLASQGVSSRGLPLLFTIPVREVLLVHLPSSYAMVEVLNRMAVMAASEYSERPGGVSPCCYFRSASGAIEKVAGPAEGDGAIKVEVRGLFEEFLETLR